MKKRLLWSLTFWWFIGTVFMFIMSLSGVLWDKQDWIFLFLVIGLIVLNVKLNKIIELHSKKKKS
tara:strand:- start:162 stop:356 length:195 start_codon:yes stop_codon:yes gene_type:complete